MRSVIGLTETGDGTTTEKETEESTQLDEVMEDIRREIVLRAAKEDRDEHRDIYDALEVE